MSLNSILSIARSALAMQQRSVDVTSHNIANAGTEGYRRQRLELSAEDPLRTAQGTIGRGVTADGVTRARDQFLDTSFRQESRLLGRFDTTNQLLSGVETIFDDSNGNGLGSGLDALLAAFGDLANDPSSASARGLVVQSAQALPSSSTRPPTVWPPSAAMCSSGCRAKWETSTISARRSPT